MTNYDLLEMVKKKIAHCQRFLEGIEEGEHPAFLKLKTEGDLQYWQKELARLEAGK
jgi:hypothetical protein